MKSGDIIAIAIEAVKSFTCKSKKGVSDFIPVGKISVIKYHKAEVIPEDKNKTRKQIITDNKRLRGKLNINLLILKGIITNA